MLCTLKNLTELNVALAKPWEFHIGEVSDRIRHNKEHRQAWYRNKDTQHQFYTGYEGLNSSVRISKDNPAHLCRALIADIDHAYTEPEMGAIIDQLPTKPSWVERSLSGKWRLIWLFDGDMRFPNNAKVAEAFLQKMLEKLGIAELRGLDRKAWFTPVQLYANGGVWAKGSDARLEVKELESTLYQIVVAQCRRSKNADVILPRIVEMIKTRWPNWEWPGEFVLSSTGPSWWVAGSVSPRSAVVHADGMWTFAAHAEKEWWTWDDILGHGAIEHNRQEHIDTAVNGYFTDGREYFQVRADGGLEFVRETSLRRILTAVHGLSPKPARGQMQSEVEQAFARLDKTCRVDSAAPFIYKPPGIFHMNSKTYLNTLDLKPQSPSAGPQQWGPHGNFPFISDWMDRVFVTPEQLSHFMAWYWWAYAPALERDPKQGQCGFLGGGVGIGKTLWSKHVLGPSLGGSVDAVKFLTDEDGFGGQLFEYGLWTVDDQTMCADVAKLRRYTGIIKRMVANPEQEFHVKYRMAASVLWMGRIFNTLNLDAWSQIVLPSLEESVLDKLCFWRWIDFKKGDPRGLPDRYFPRDVEDVLARERPFFLRWLLDRGIPEEWRGSYRFGVIEFQDEQMRRASYLNSGSAPMYETISLFLDYQHNTGDVGSSGKWRGTTAQLMADMTAMPCMHAILKGVTIQNLNRHLMHMESLGTLAVTSEMNAREMRIWTIARNNKI